jgi:hypothetical protein
MNPTTARRKPAGIAVVGTVAALAAFALAACGGPDRDTTDGDHANAADGSAVQQGNEASPGKDIDNDDDGVNDQDADDRTLSAAERESAEKAALEAVGTGTVTSVEGSDDPGVAYEIDVQTTQGEWDVDLDAKFAVVSKTKEN